MWLPASPISLLCVACYSHLWQKPGRRMYGCVISTKYAAIGTCPNRSYTCPDGTGLEIVSTRYFVS